MASDPSPPRSDSYQRYIEARDSAANILLGLCAGRGGLLRIQRQQALKYFQGLPDPEQIQESEIAKEEIGTRSVRHPLSREDSKISNSGTSYYSAISYQPIEEDDIVEQGYQPQRPNNFDILDLSAPYTISAHTNVQDDRSGPRSTLLLPAAHARPKRYIDLDADCEIAAKAPKLPDAPKPKPPPVIVKVHPLSAYLSQYNKATRWDIVDWINDCAEYEREARERVRKPTHLRQCPEYYLTKNFNPLSVHKPWSPREERTNKNMEMVLMSTGWAAEPTIHLRIKLARIEEARKAKARMDEARKVHDRQEVARRAQARTAKAAIAAEVAFLQRQARKARRAPESLEITKPAVHKLTTKAHKVVHFALDQVPRVKTTVPGVPEVLEAPKIVLREVDEVPKMTIKEVDEVPAPSDAISQNPRFKVECSAPIDIPKPSKYPRRGPEMLSENMRRGMKLIAASRMQ